MSRQVYFDVPTADNGLLIKAATELLESCFVNGAHYHRAGVILWNFVPEASLQTDVFGNLNVMNEKKSAKRLRSFDSINERYGKYTMRYATELLGASHESKQSIRSPRYVSNWSELPSVRIPL